MKNYKTIGITLLVIMISSFTMSGSKSQVSIDKAAILAQHNFYRDKVGVPHLEWSDELAEYAQNWADKLAKECDLYHSVSNYGESIYVSNKFSNEADAVDYWAYEEKYFDHNDRIFKRDKAAIYGHYTQIIWRKTTHVGGAYSDCEDGTRIWVCNYSPHGNVVGRETY